MPVQTLYKTNPTVTREELITDGSDAEFRQLVHNLFAFAARHEAVRDGHAALIGLAGVEYTVLISIAHLSRDAPVNVTLLANHLRVTGTFVTRTVNALVKKGLVSKESDKTDRRIVQLKVTDEGLDVLAQLAPKQAQVNDIQFKSLSRSEFLLLNKIIAQLIDDSEEALALQSYLRKSSFEKK